MEQIYEFCFSSLLCLLYLFLFFDLHDVSVFEAQSQWFFLIARVCKACTVFMPYLCILCTMGMFSYLDRNMEYSAYVWFLWGIRHGCPMYIYDKCVMDALCLFVKKNSMSVCMYTCMDGYLCIWFLWWYCHVCIYMFCMRIKLWMLYAHLWRACYVCISISIYIGFILTKYHVYIHDFYEEHAMDICPSVSRMYCFQFLVFVWSCDMMHYRFILIYSCLFLYIWTEAYPLNYL